MTTTSWFTRDGFLLYFLNMKTSLVIWSAVLALSSTLSAQPAPQPAAAPGTAQRRIAKAPRVMDPAMRSNMLARTGGMVRSPAEGPAILFLNTQTRVAAEVMSTVTDQVSKNLSLPVASKVNPSAEPVAEALNALSDKGTAAVVVIADTPGYPSLLVAPENRWALVNVAALGGAGVTAETLADRTQKEVWRAFGYLMGAANSNFEHCLLKPVLDPTDLDALKAKVVCPEPFNKIMTYAEKLGMKPQRTTTYRKAVEEGLAPAPANDFQKAIWKELKK